MADTYTPAQSDMSQHVAAAPPKRKKDKFGSDDDEDEFDDDDNSYKPVSASTAGLP